MAQETAAIDPEPGPNELRDPFVRKELKRATVWLGLAAAMALVVVLIQPILIIFGGLVFAAMLDGGVQPARAACCPIGRGLRLLIVDAVRRRLRARRLLYDRGSGRGAGRAAARDARGAGEPPRRAGHRAMGLMPGRADVNGLIAAGDGLLRASSPPGSAPHSAR